MYMGTAVGAFALFTHMSGVAHCNRLIVFVMCDQTKATVKGFAYSPGVFTQYTPS